MLIKGIKMTAEQFVSWISGYLELSQTLSDREVIIKSALSRLSALDFCYYLSGSFECGGYELTKAELVMQDHLSMVFTKVTPDRNVDTIPKNIKNPFIYCNEEMIKQYPIYPHNIQDTAIC